MTAADRLGFAELLCALGETYGEPISDARLEIYFTALGDLELDALRAALNAHVRTSKWFPKPAEIREAVHGSVEDAAEIAWLAVVQLVRRLGLYQPPMPTDWPNEQTRRTALDQFGGWRGLCEHLAAAGTPEFLGTAKQFKAAFGAYARRDQAALPPSREEARALLHETKKQLLARGLPTGAL